MTVTHPHHPLRGQQLAVVCVRHGVSPDVIVRLPDGSHAAVALRDTDQAVPSPTDQPAVVTSHLLDLSKLRQLAQFVADLRRQGRFPGPA